MYYCSTFATKYSLIIEGRMGSPAVDLASVKRYGRAKSPVAFLSVDPQREVQVVAGGPRAAFLALDASIEEPMADAALFRKLALAFDGAVEYPHFDRRAFKARVTFATLAPDQMTANIKFAPDEQALKCAVAPDAFAPLDNAWGRQGWTRATLAALSEEELKAALEMAYRLGAAPKAKGRGRRR